MATRYRDRRPRAKTNGGKFLGLGLFLGVVLIVVSAGFGVVNLADRWLSDIPDYTSKDAFAVAMPSKVYSADGVVLAEFATENRIPTTIDKVSSYVIRGTIDTEDIRFYEHNGVDIQGIGRAVFSVLGGRSEGASTITQQLVRNTVLLDEMTDYTIKRKVREAFLALKVEEIYSKDEILMMYLNTINYGDGAYGIEAAAQHYFSKSAADLTLAEAALLVAIPQSPTNLNPVYNPNDATARRNLVLNRMLTAGDITQEEYDAARAEELTLNVTEWPSHGIYAYPYFTSYVRAQLSNQFSDAEIFRGGLTVETTLDTRLQDAAESACNSALENQNEELEYSLTCVDPDNGHVLAMVGGRDYYTDQFNLATQARRQAGSSFKTFTLVTAISQGVSPQMTIDSSSPAQITKSWKVSNSEGTGYGQMGLAQATWLSVNTVYARLAHELGADPIVQTCVDMGITSPLEPVESICLGTEGVCTMEMANAYATLANGGTRHDAIVITRVTDSTGAVLYEAPDSSYEAISPEVAYATTEVLQGVVNGGTGWRARLYNGQTSAGKTGTSEHNRDNWYCGYTPDLACAIWLGSRTETSIRYNGSSGYGGTTCAPVWRSFISDAYDVLDLDIKSFTKPKTEVKYDWDRWKQFGYASSSSGGEDSTGQTDSQSSTTSTTSQSQTTTNTDTNTNTNGGGGNTDTGGNGGGGNTDTGGNGGGGGNTDTGGGGGGDTGGGGDNTDTGGGGGTE